ncbi:MAG: hypothetical protein V1774_02000 [Candidatus Eisenbacteria bacterium]
MDVNPLVDEFLGSSRENAQITHDQLQTSQLFNAEQIAWLMRLMSEVDDLRRAVVSLTEDVRRYRE